MMYNAKIKNIEDKILYTTNLATTASLNVEMRLKVKYHVLST